MKKGAFYIAFATLVFSTMEIALKFVSGQFDPIQMTFSRFFVGGLVLLPVALKKIKEKLPKRLMNKKFQLKKIKNNLQKEQL